MWALSVALCLCSVSASLQIFPDPVQNRSMSYGLFVGGQFFAKQGGGDAIGRRLAGERRITPFGSVPLNGLGQWAEGGSMSPIGEGVFASGTVARMIRNHSSVILVGSFQWARCQLRSCGDNGDFSDQRVLRNLAMYEFSTSLWSGMGLGCAGVVNDVVVYGDTVLIGGNFSRCFNDETSPYVPTRNVANWSLANGWKDVGGQFVVGEVSSLARDPKTGFIYAVGSSLGGSNPYVFLQVYNKKDWAIVSQLNLGLKNSNAFNVVRVFGDWVYVGGSFYQFADSDSYSSNIVRLPTSDLFSVDALNGGVDGPVYDIVQYPDGSVIAGGTFQHANEPGPVEVNGLAIFSDSDREWSSFHDFQLEYRPDWQVWSLDVLPDGAVVAGGFFQSVGNASMPVNNMAVFSQGIWRTIGPAGSDDALRNFTMSSVVFTGQHEVLGFGYSGESGDNVLASYLESDGWSFDRQALLESGTVLCASVSSQHGLMVGGEFVSNGTAAVRSLALWNGTSITSIGGGVVGRVRGCSFMGDKVFVVGAFRVPPDTRTNAFGSYDLVEQRWSFPEVAWGNTFRSLEPFLCMHVLGDLVFMGGSFSVSPSNVSVGADMLAVYETTGGAFGDVAPTSTISWSVASRILAMTDNKSHLFVAGQFQLVTSSGTYFNLACLELLTNEWVPIATTCDTAEACGGDSINALAWSGDRLYVAGNFSYIGSGIRLSVNNIAILKNGQWLQMQYGLEGLIVKTMSIAQSDSGDVVACGGAGFVKFFDVVQRKWVDLDSDWTFSFHVYSVFVLVPYYYARPFVSLVWTAPVIVLAVLMMIFFVVGLTIVIVLMRRRGRSSHLQEYSLLDVSAHDEDAWLIEYESLTIYNPPIGKGAYSVVNRAVLKGTVVAVKTYVGQDYYGDLKADFNREIALLTRLRHPNIILFIGACRTPLCIVTELAERGCLYDVIHTTPQEMTWSRIKSIALDSCRGLAYLHNQTPPILHRDLKTANVLISDSFVAKISDFGIAKRLAIHTMTMRVGTTRWMAPEVLTSKGSSTAYSLGSDVYSFGVIVWEMLTLKLPWGNVSFDHQIEDRVTSGEVLQIFDFAAPYRDILLSCWNLDAQLRPMFTELIGKIDAVPMIEGSPDRPIESIN